MTAQNWNDSESAEHNYFESVARFYQKWTGDPEEKGRGWKAFKRWEWHWRNRIILPEGRLPSPAALSAEWDRYQRTHAMPESVVASNWNSLGPFTSESGYGGIGRVNCVAFDPVNPNVIWVGAPAGGLWKSTNGGQSWTTGTDQLAVLGVSAIAIDPVNPNIMYIGTGDGDAADTYSIGVLKSTDGGQSWNSTGLSFQVTQLMRVRQLLIQPGTSNTLLAATTTGIFISKNAGATWTESIDGNFYDLKYKPDNPNIVYASTRDKVYKSTNGGNNWTAMKTIPVSGRLALAVTPANPLFLYVLSSVNDPGNADAYGGYNGLYVSTDAGDTYTLQSSTPNILSGSASGSGVGGQGWYDLCIAADPLNANTVYIGGVNTWKSTNGGLNWTIKTHWTNGAPATATITHADKHCMVWQNNTTLFQGNDGGLYKTSNGANNWTDLSNGLIISQMYTVGLSQSNNSILCGLQDNGTKGLIGGIWDDVGGGDGMECFINPVSPNVMYRSTQRGSLSRSTNGAVSWSGITPPGESGKGAWITPYIIDPTTPTTIYCAYKSIYKSTNQGTNWTKIGSNILTDTNAVFTLLAVAPNQSNTIYAAVSKDIYRTVNGGANWTKITNNLPLSSANLSWIAVAPYDPNTVFVTLGNYSSGRKVFKSSNGGASWINISGTLPNLPANTIVYHKGSKEGLYVGMDVGIFYRDSLMSDWIPYNTGLPNVPVSDLEIHQNTGKIYAATFGRGLWSAAVRPAPVKPAAQFSASPVSGDAPLTVQFTDLSTNTPTQWTWNFGNGQTATAQNPSVTYTQPGIYTVSLKAGNAAGVDSLVKTALIEVKKPVIKPAALFSASPISGDAPLTVQFTDLSTNTPTQWTWNFGNGQTATAQHPSVTYTQPGIYTVSLKAGNAAGVDSLVKTALIEVKKPVIKPAAQFSASPVSGDAPLTVQFTDLSTNNPTQWIWDFGNGQTATAQNPSVTYTQPGIYTVSLKAGNTAGVDSLVKTTYIEVKTPVIKPAAQFSASPVSGDAPLTVQFTDLSTNTPTQWIWDFGNGETATTQNPSVTYTQPGVYTVSLKAGNAAGVDSLVKTALIEVKTPVVKPAAQFSANPVSGDAPLTVQFTDLSTNNPMQWTWDFGNGQTATTQNPSITYTQPGIYTVSLKAGNTAGVDSLVKTALIEVKTPVVKPAARFSGPQGCVGLDSILVFTDNSDNQPEQWEWFFPGGTPENATEPNPSVHYSTPGQYDIILVVSNAAGSDTLIQRRYLTVVQPLMATTNTDTVVCRNSPLLFGVTGADTYRWDGPGGTLTGNQVQAKTDSAGLIIYHVIGTFYQCSTPNLLFRAQILPVPALTLIPPPGPVCQGDTIYLEASGAAEYRWDGPYLLQNSSAGVYAVAADTGVLLYHVRGFAASGCPSDVETIRIDVHCQSVATDDGIGHEPRMQVIPNPTTGRVSLWVRSQVPDTGSIGLYNSLGQCLDIQPSQIFDGDRYFDFDLGLSPAGTYWIKVKYSGATRTLKVIKH